MPARGSAALQAFDIRGGQVRSQIRSLDADHPVPGSADDRGARQCGRRRLGLSIFWPLMRVSQFEIYRLIQRSMEALGAGYGVDRDAARFVAWLEARGLPGLAAFEQELGRLETGLPMPRLIRHGEREIEI